jgi:hypothetical protein
MPLAYEIVAEDPQVRVVGTGAVSMASMIAIIQQVAADPRFRSQFTVTFDLRATTYTAELADGEALVAVLRQKKTDFQNRFAVVVPDALHVLGKLYCLLAAMGGFDKIKCFPSIEEAQAWCRIPP